jgi:hypothetical protein
MVPPDCLLCCCPRQARLARCVARCATRGVACLGGERLQQCRHLRKRLLDAPQREALCERAWVRVTEQIYRDRAFLLARTRWGKIVSQQDFYEDSERIGALDARPTELVLAPVSVGSAS